MFLKLKACLFGCLLVLVSTAEAQETCTLQIPPDKCNLIIQNQSSFSSSSTGQGLPGKRGPLGPKGNKGERGPAGISSDASFNEELEVVRRKLSLLQARLNRTEAAMSAKDEEIAQLRSQIERINSQSSEGEPKTCRDVPKMNGTYLIRPDRSRSFIQVECTFTPEYVVTSVHHDAEAETKVDSRCAGKHCFTRNLRYEHGVKFYHMRALIERIGNCRQFIKYRCFGSVIFSPQHGNYAGWISHDGRTQTYWGGSEGRERYCACGVTETCHTPYFKCNCDTNDIVERADEGYLTVNDDLPVSSVLFGDVNDEGEKGYYTVGPLECIENI